MRISAARYKDGVSPFGGLRSFAKCGGLTVLLSLKKKLIEDKKGPWCGFHSRLSRKSRADPATLPSTEGGLFLVSRLQLPVLLGGFRLGSPLAGFPGGVCDFLWRAPVCGDSSSRTRSRFLSGLGCVLGGVLVGQLRGAELGACEKE